MYNVTNKEIILIMQKKKIGFNCTGTNDTNRIIIILIIILREILFFPQQPQDLVGKKISFIQNLKSGIAGITRHFSIIRFYFLK